ncbi:unnamed protein product [Durusdinium trenchii]|uniref:Uncharacterized protein n=3 Tax=Durusdinium trenchii TaxID=1381693 RepID=A0ABP0P5B3_9DINO
MPRLAPQEVAWLEKMLPQDAMLPSSHLQLAMPKMHRPQRVATFFQTHGAQGEEIHAEGITSELRPFVAQDTRSIYARKFFSSFQEKQVVCAINMRERYPGMQTKRCCEEASEASCLACCQEHFASRGEKCVEVCGTMCAFGWDKGNRKVPQCPEKLGSEDGGAEEWYAEDPMKDRPRPAVPVTWL